MVMDKKNRKIFSDIIKKAKNGTPVLAYCSQHTLLISIVNDFFRCLTCGGDIEQKVNGKINYIPVQLQEFDEVKKDG